jgi:tRNA (guanine37-N1)-methyltransferase
VTSQREKAEHIASLWLEEAPARPPPATGSRAGALALVRTADSLDRVVETLTAEYGRPPLVVATSAKAESFPAAERRTPDQLRAEATLDPAPLLIVLGTGWGLADPLIPSVCVSRACADRRRFGLEPPLGAERRCDYSRPVVWSDPTT